VKVLNIPDGTVVRDYDSNNAWGFGGMVGKEYILPTGEIIRTGKACFRHLPPEPISYALLAPKDGRRERVELSPKTIQAFINDRSTKEERNSLPPGASTPSP
jgi:hypothetical protein